MNQHRRREAGERKEPVLPPNGSAPAEAQHGSAGGSELVMMYAAKTAMVSRYNHVPGQAPSTLRGVGRIVGANLSGRDTESPR